MKFILLLLVILSVAFAETCGGNCPGGKCPNCPCGTNKRMEDISTWCAKHSWNQACCKCIVSHESGGNANSMNYNTNGSFDVGLWQINKVNWSCNGGNAPCDPTANLNCAIKVYAAAGNSWRPWSTHSGCGC
jgi:hypothetical protein